MAEIKVTYKEPASYFTPEMLKVAQEYEKTHPDKNATQETPDDSKPEKKESNE